MDYKFCQDKCNAIHYIEPKAKGQALCHRGAFPLIMVSVLEAKRVGHIRHHPLPVTEKGGHNRGYFHYFGAKTHENA